MSESVIQRKGFLQKLLSYFREEIVESVDSKVSGKLEVWFVYGRYELNAPNVNYSFGSLHKVFRDAFRKMKVQERKVESVLVLGLGAGSIPTILFREMNLECSMTGVELDPEMIKLGEKYFGLSEFGKLKIEQEDAILFVEECEDHFDLIAVDLFVDDIVPTKAEEKIFLQKLDLMLNPRGVLFFNRLALNAQFIEDAELFLEKAQEALPGARYIQAAENSMLVFEKK